MKIGSWLFRKVCAYLMKEPKKEGSSYLCDFERICHEIMPGDVLLIEGGNKISKIIKRITYSRWTHAALYIGRLQSIEDPQLRQIIRKYYQGSASQQLLVESIVGIGTLISPITKYHQHHIRICRPTGLSYADAQKVLAFSINHVGRKYNLRLFVDLGRFMLASKFIPSRWKSSLFQENPGEATEDICSAMIASAFESIQFPIRPLIRETEGHHLEMIHRNPKLFTPSDFDYSPYFAIIKYPIFPRSHNAPYRDLPWHEGLMSNDMEVVTLQNEPTKEN